MTPTHRDVDVVIVTYDSKEFVRGLAASIREIRRVAGVVVVDNSAHDETTDAVLAEDWGHPVTLVRRPDNPGFGAAVGQGVASASGAPYLAIVNPDLLMDSDSLDELVRVLEDQPETGVVGAQLVTPAGVPVSSARLFPSARSILQRQAIDVDHGAQVVDADWICGALMLWRTVDWHRVAGFDDRYFLYFEDVDICRRLWTQGRNVKIAGHVTIVHNQGHGVETSADLRWVNRRSRRLYAKQWLGWRGVLAAIVADWIDVAKDTTRKRLQ